jgi:RNA polymerase sigma factor (sigma-70 family)
VGRPIHGCTRSRCFNAIIQTPCGFRLALRPHGRKPHVALPPQNPDDAAWFAAHVQPHEPMLRAWLRSRFPRENDLDDIVQEALARIVRAHAGGTLVIQSPKAFLFATARNLALGRLRHRQVAGEENFLAENTMEGVLDEAADVPQAVARAQELELLTHAIQSLPTRCRQIITLRKIYGLSQKEVAAQLGISEHTVEAQGTIGLRKLAGYFERHEREGKG